MNNRLMNIRLATLFFSLSILLIAGSAYFIYAASSVSRAQTTKILAAQCVKEFEVAGFKAIIRPQDHAIVHSQSSVDMMQERVNASSVIIGRCAGYRLAEFCAGKGCAKPGVFFVLETL